MTSARKLPDILFNEDGTKAIDRFWSNVIITDTCWVWSGYKIKGYGSISINGRCWPAHRVSLALHLGRDIPQNLVVMHSCDNPSCVNPRHLKEATQKENLEDCISKHRIMRPQQQMFCKNGHAYTPETTRIGKYNKKTCRVCDMHRKRLERAKKCAN